MLAAFSPAGASPIAATELEQNHSRRRLEVKSRSPPDRRAAKSAAKLKGLDGRFSTGRGAESSSLSTRGFVGREARRVMATVAGVTVLIADRDPASPGKESDAVMYEFRCASGDAPARHWSVLRRYSECLAFHTQLVADARAPRPDASRKFVDRDDERAASRKPVDRENVRTRRVAEIRRSRRRTRGLADTRRSRKRS
jgi:hypothetical protein